MQENIILWVHLLQSMAAFIMLRDVCVSVHDNCKIQFIIPMYTETLAFTTDFNIIEKLKIRLKPNLITYG